LLKQLKVYFLEMSKLNVKRITGIKKRNKVKPFKTFSDGYELGNTLTQKWNSQSNPSKVYIGGYRIHHGLVGALLGLAGLITEKPAITGLGVKLALDDIDDMPDWLNFERNNMIQYNDTSIPLGYNEFA
jgi:hypothetical protein